MRIGVGLPTSTPPLGGRHRGPELLDVGDRGPRPGPFTSLGVTDRLVYDCTDPLVALAAAAAVTDPGPPGDHGGDRPDPAGRGAGGPGRLARRPVRGPARPSACRSGPGRTTTTPPAPTWRGRGRQLSDQLAAMRDIWEGSERRAPAGQPRRAGPPGRRRERRGVPPGRPPRRRLRPRRRAAPGLRQRRRPGPGGVDRRRPAGRAAAVGPVRTSPSPTPRPAPPTCATTTPSPGPSPSGWRPASSTPRRPSGNTSPATPRRGCDELVLLPATSDPAELDRLADVLAG